MAQAETDSRSSEVLVVSDEPHCTETSTIHLDEWITPTDRFYVRSHFADMPRLDPESYVLTVDGAVEAPLGLRYDQVLALPSIELAATMECAGNSRAFMTPPAEGLQFQHGAVGNARWRGVRVSELLSRAAPRDKAVEVLFEGADLGEEEEEGESFELGYARSLPMAKALSPDTLLAYEMNGQPLTPQHGFPLRLLVPGWYGMASVKWLTRVRVLEEPFDGFFQKRRYIDIREGKTDEDSWEPVSTLRVKSLITHPRHGEVVQPGAYVVTGMAWSGEGEITGVDVSVDGGLEWQEAQLVGETAQMAWRRWEYSWRPSKAGHFILQARATDSAGMTQPAAIPWNFRGYANNGIHTIAVEVPAE